MARRDEGEYRAYLTEEQRRQAGCITGRMQRHFHHGLLALRRQPESVGGDGRTEGIPDHTLESVPAAGADANGGVEIEAVLSRMTGPGSR